MATSDGTTAFKDLFWHLANVSPDVRIKATATLVNTVLTLESNASQSSRAGPHEGRFTGITGELAYTLKRLCKGLLSSRDAARQGFASALTELLGKTKVDFKQVYELILDEVILAKSNSDIGVKDRKLGLIFAAGSLARSNIVSKAFASNSTQAIALEASNRIISELLSDDLQKMTPLLEAASEVLISILQQIPKTHWNTHVHKHLVKIFKMNPQDMQPEHLSIILNVQRLFDYSPASDNPQSWNKDDNLFGRRNINNFVHGLHLSVRTVPRIHKVWIHMLESIFRPQHIAVNSEVIESNLNAFSNTILLDLIRSDTIDHKYLAICVALLSMEFLKTATHWKIIFSPDLLDLFCENVTKRGSLLYEICRDLADKILEHAAGNNTTLLAILTRIAGPYIEFERLDLASDKKIVTSLIKLLDESSAIQYVQHEMQEFYCNSIPTDLVPKFKEVKKLNSSTDPKLKTTQKRQQKKTKSKKIEEDMDIDEEIDVPDETVVLEEIKVNPTTFLLARRKTILHHLNRVAILLHESHPKASLRVLEWLYTNSRFTSQQVLNGNTWMNVDFPFPLVESMNQFDFDAELFKQQYLKLLDQLETQHSKSPNPSQCESKAPSSSSKNGSSKPNKNSKDFASLNESTEAPKKKDRVAAIIQFTEFWVSPLLQLQNKLLNGEDTKFPGVSKNAKFIPRFDKGTIDSMQEVASALVSDFETTSSSNGADAAVTQQAQLLKALVKHIQALDVLPVEESLRTLKDLQSLQTYFFPSQSSNSTPHKSHVEKDQKSTHKQKNKPNTMEIDGAKESTPAEVFVEVLIALLLRAPKSLKFLVEQSFAAFGSKLTPESLGIIIEALQESPEADDESDDEGDDMEYQNSDSEELNENELEDLKELIGFKGKKVNAEESSGSESEDDEGSGTDSHDDDSQDKGEANREVNSDSHDDDEDLDEKTKRKLAEVLKAAGAAMDSDESDEEITFDDEKMLELDAGLASVAREIRAAQIASKKKREHKMTALELEALDFKTKLLVLIDTFAEYFSKTHLFFTLFEGLIQFCDQLASSKSQAPLLSRLLATFNRITKAKELDDTLDGPTLELVHTLIENIFESQKQKLKPAQVECRQIVLVYLLKVLVHQKDRSKALQIERLRKNFHGALQNYANSSRSEHKARSLFIGIYTQLFHRVPLLHLLLLDGCGAALAECESSTFKPTLACELFSSVTKAIVLSQPCIDLKHDSKASSGDRNSPAKERRLELLNNVCIDFLAIFKNCIQDSNISIHVKKNLMAVMLDLFKISFGLRENGLEFCKKLFQVDAIASVVEQSFQSDASSKESAENFIFYLKNGKQKPKYANEIEKKKQREIRQNARKEQQSKQGMNSKKRKEPTKPKKHVDDDRKDEKSSKKAKK